MPADPHVALRDPEPPGDLRAAEASAYVRVRTSRSSGSRRSRACRTRSRRSSEMRSPGVVRAFRRRGAEAAQRLGLPARRAVTPLADVDGGRKRNDGQRLEFSMRPACRASIPRRIVSWATSSASAKFRTRRPTKYRRRFSKCLDVLSRSAGFALGRGDEPRPVSFPNSNPCYRNQETGQFRLTSEESP